MYGMNYESLMWLNYDYIYIYIYIYIFIFKYITYYSFYVMFVKVYYKWIENLTGSGVTLRWDDE